MDDTVSLSERYSSKRSFLRRCQCIRIRLMNYTQVSIVGLLLGPMCPLLIGHASRIIPTTILTGSLSMITGLRSAGATAFPFATGVLVLLRDPRVAALAYE